MLALLPRPERPEFLSVVKNCTRWIRGGRACIVYWNGRTATEVCSLQSRASLFTNIAGLILDATSYQFSFTHSFRWPTKAIELLDELSVSVAMLWQRSFQSSAAQTAHQALTGNIGQARLCMLELEWMQRVSDVLLRVECRRVFGPDESGKQPSLQEIYRIQQDGLQALYQLETQQPSVQYPQDSAWQDFFTDIKQDAVKVARGILKEWGRRLGRPLIARWMVQEAPMAGLQAPQGWQHLDLPQLIDAFVADGRAQLQETLGFDRQRSAKLKELGGICKRLLEQRLGDSDALTRLACFCAQTVQIERAELACYEGYRLFSQQEQAPQGPDALHRALLEQAPAWLREDAKLWQLYQERAALWSPATRQPDTAAKRNWELQNFCTRMLPGLRERHAGIRADWFSSERNERVLLTELDAILAELHVTQAALETLQRASPLEHAANFDLQQIIEDCRQLRGLIADALREREIQLLKSLEAIHGPLDPKAADITLHCGADHYPLHRIALLRLGENMPALFCGVKHNREKTDLTLPAELGNNIGLMAVLYYLYHGQIPEAARELHGEQLLATFRMAFALPPDAGLDQLPQTQPSDWFGAQLLPVSDLDLPCLDGPLPFYRALLAGSPALKNAEALPFTRAECRCLLQLLLGDLDSIDWGAHAWKRFTHLQQHADLVLGAERWKSLRRKALAHCLKQASADELLEAVAYAQVHPAQRLIKLCNNELLTRLADEQVDLQPFLQLQRRCLVRISCTQRNYSDAAWERIAQFLTGATRLQQVSFAGSNIASHHVLKICKACTLISHLDLYDCRNIHPAIRSLATGEEPEQLPTFLDALTVHLLRCHKPSRQTLKEASERLEQGPQPLLDARAMLDLLRITDGDVERLNLLDNPHVDHAYLQMLAQEAPGLRNLQLPDNGMNPVQQLRALSQLGDLRHLEGAGDQVANALRATTHKDLNQELNNE